MNFFKAVQNILKNQAGIAHPLIILVLLAGLGIGVFLVSQRTNILPHAQQEVIGPQTAFHLFLSDNYPRGEAYGLDGEENSAESRINPAKRNWFYPGEKIQVDVAVSTDIDYSNVFNANISFPNDFLEITSLKLNSRGNEKMEGSTQSQESTSGGEVSDDGSISISQQGGKAKLKARVVSQKSERTGKKPEICAQVITKACKLDNKKICKEFPTPCDVPKGWEIENPNPSSVPTCRPRPACLDETPPCLTVQTSDMCPPEPGKVRDYFINFWVEQNFDNNTGTISLVGGVPEKGIKTSPPGKPVMATIIFKAKKPGNPEIKFNDTSAIIRASDNTNILAAKKNLSITIKDKDIVKVPGDIDGDGKVGLKDLSALLSKWGTDDKNADLNNDGKVNIYDFSVLLSNWGR